MLRLIGGIVAGLVAWAIVVTVLNLGLRYGWPAYGAVEKAMTFTLAMMIARLSESAVSSLVSGYVAGAVGRNKWAPVLTGVVLLLPFAYFHSTIWDKFPIWYHLTFLTSLPVLSIAGGWLALRKAR
jgi:hypothetical protein